MITAILVDDEEKSLKNLELLINSHCPEIEIIHKANNALDAVKNIIASKPVVTFLDVQMPGYNGFDVLENIKEIDTTIVFTTAHKDHAINALRKGAFDYLLKPIDIDELKDCVARVKEKLESDEFSQDQRRTHYGIIELSVRDGIIFVKPEQIIRLEASGSYCTFYLENNVKHVMSKSLKEYEQVLDPDIFCRCHNSHIVNLRMVTKFINSDGLFAELSDKSVIEISRRNKEVFLEKLKNLRH